MSAYIALNYLQTKLFQLSLGINCSEFGAQVKFEHIAKMIETDYVL